MNKPVPSLELDLLFQWMPDLYLIIDNKFNIVTASNNYIKATGLQLPKMAGKSIFETFPVNPKSPSDAKKLQESLSKTLKYKKTDVMAVLRYAIINPKTKKYEDHYWSITNTPILNSDQEVMFIINRVEDVTDFIQKKAAYTHQNQRLELEVFQRAEELQEANCRLQESEEILRLFMESSKDYAFIMLDTNGIVTHWNGGAERIKGYKASEIIGKHFSIFYPQQAIDEHHLEYELKIAREHGNFEEEGWRLRKDGTQFWANVILTPIYNDKAKLIGYGKVTRDLSERKNTDQIKKEFISVVSHELRTPLTSIRGAIGLVLGGAAGECSEKAKGFLTIANTNCERLVRLINNILDIEKIEAGKINFKMVYYDLGTVVTDAVNSNKMYAEKFGIKLKCRSLKSIIVNIDVDRITQVLTNLISNAVKFSRTNGAVTVIMSRNNTHIEVAIRDEGLGIPDSFKQKIFEKFSQADSSSTRTEAGTGLGLAISKAIIEKHNSNLLFETKVGQGTTFYFTLPIVNRDCITLKLPYPKTKDVNSVLICEDDEVQASILACLLQESGYQTEICHSTAQAKRLLNENTYYALILDLILPDGSGIDLIKSIRNSKKNQILPIIVISIIAKDAQSLMKGSACRVIDWLDKPIDFNKLAKAFSTIQETTHPAIPQLLHIEDDEDSQEIVKNLFEDRAKITLAATLQDAQKSIQQGNFDLAILDLNLPDGNGVDLLPTLSQHKIPVIVFARSDLEPQFENYVQQCLVKSQTSPEKLLNTINQFLTT